MISSAEFAAYNRAVARIGDKAASDVESSVLAWCRANASASVAEKREAAKLIMEGYIQGYDDIAAEFAAEWYDHRAQKSGVALDQAITMTTYEPESVDAVARYQAKKLAKGGDAEFAKACGEFARNDAFRSLNETIIANVGRDRDKGARFARVPTGFETCTFCLMLASRGAVYHSRKTAGEFKHFHRNCNCKVVPGFEDNPDDELVEGIKPGEMRDQWWKFEKIDATEGLSSAERDEMKRLVLDGGELPEVVRKTNPAAHMRKDGRASSGWISAGARLDAEVKAHGFRDVSDFYEYLESRRSAAEIVEAGVLGEKILGNADATPKFYEIVKGHLHKSVELVDGVSPKELREWSKRFKEIDETEGLSAAEKDARKRAVVANPLLGTRADPALEYFGPAELDDPVKLKEIQSWLKGNGFEIRVSSGGRERIGYSPGNKAGDQGQVIVTEGMSLSAWLHETDHAKFDLENGLPGLMAYLADYKLREEMERRAYGVEISIAEEAGYNDLVARLQDLLKEEIDRLEADFGSV